MNPSEAAELLAVASAIDPRLRPPSTEDAKARSVLWSQTLDTDLPFTIARMMIGAHYRESTDGVMPAHINRLWRAHRRSEAEAQRTAIEQRQSTEAAAKGVPMPSEVKKQLLKTLKTTKTP